MPPELYTDRALFWIGSLLYALAFLFALASISSNREHIRTIFMTLLAGGFIFQSLGLYFRGIQEHAFPTSNPFEVLQVMAWCAICLNLILRQIFKLKLLNFFSAGLAAVVGIVSLAVPGWDYIPPLSPLEGSPWVGFHAALAVFSYGVFGVLAITSLMYLMQNHGLTRRKSGGIFSLLPAIRQLEDINSKLIMLGVSVLTVSIAVGFLNWISQPGTVGVIKLLIAVAVWVAYLVL
ncbi:MAG: cytochrome c biogenesis protein CcsA, partial [Verrucomicrobiota bacterium]